MEKRIVYTRPDGGVSIVVPAPRARGSVLVSPAVIEERELAPAITGPDPDDPKRTVEVAPAVRGPVEVAPAVWREETDEEFIARIMVRDVPAEAANVRIVDAADLPSDRSFRDAWRAPAAAIEPVPLAGGALAIDMVAAREVHRDRIRAARAPLLAELDVAYLRAAESGDAGETAAIVARKQALRDAPADPAIAKARTPAALMAAWPSDVPSP